MILKGRVYGKLYSKYRLRYEDGDERGLKAFPIGVSLRRFGEIDL